MSTKTARNRAGWLLGMLALVGGLGTGAVRGQGDVVISEVLALNQDGITDGDGDHEDWLELYNPGTTDVDLDGWHLTDDPTWLTKWSFPPITLPAGAHLVVFASGKDRDDPAGELHTNFRLDGGGEYLALVLPDGSTVIHEMAPSFPEQRPDVSWGLPVESRVLVPVGATARYLVPQSGALGDSWREEDFVPGPEWASGPTGLGYSSAGGAAFPQPASYWPLDGDTLDAAGGRDGSFDGGDAPEWVDGFDGRAEGAIRFDGGNDLLDLPTGDVLPAYDLPAYTIAMWVRGLPQNDRRVWSDGSGSSGSPLFTIGTDNTGSTGAVDIFIRGDGGSAIMNHRHSAGIAFDDTWHHIAWVDEDGDARLYIDGELDPVDFSYGREALTLDLTSIGAVLRATACCFFEGEIDDAAVWDQALDGEAIAALAAGAPPGEGSLHGAYIATDIGDDMEGRGTSLYARLPFNMDDPSDVERIALSLRYEDGFVAWLNGVEIARAGAPASLGWDSAATEPHGPPEALEQETFVAELPPGTLRAGENVLAVQGLAREGADSFLLQVELVATGALLGDPRFFSTPTPGGPNGGGSVDFVADTKFSVDRGFHTVPFALEITTETPGAEIRYTLDGSAPSADHGFVYTGPIDVSTTTLVRAAAFLDGFEPTNVDTHSYIFLDDVIRQPADPPGFPSVWQPGWEADYEMDPEICTDMGSPHYQPSIREDLQAIPTLSIVMDPDDLFGPSRGIYNHSESRGVAWERSASAELIVADAPGDGFQVDCGVRMQGGASRFNERQVKHSFRLLFKGIYGPTKLRYRWFGDTRVDRFDTVILRAFFTDGWATRTVEPRYRPADSQYMRDVWMKDTMLDMGHPSGHNAYVHLYINGLYWGLYNATERPDASFHAQHYGGDKDEDWDVYKDAAEVFDGTGRMWDQLMSVSASAGTTTGYRRLQGLDADGLPDPALPVLLDVDNLIDYMVLHIFAGAEDWPHHNWFAARRSDELSTGWHFIVWDQEIVLDDLARNRVNEDDRNTPAYVYDRLRGNPEFRVRFGDRVQKHFFHGGALSVEACADRWMERAADIDRAIVGESARWGDRRREVPHTRDVEWLAEQAVVVSEYLPTIHPLTLERLRDADLYPEVAPPVLSQHGGAITSGFRLAMGAPVGTVYYTLDGPDPRLEGGAVAPEASAMGAFEEVVLVEPDALARVRVPDGPDAGTTWYEPDFGDESWTSGPMGVGYERQSGYEPYMGTDVEASMYGTNGTVQVRVEFDVDTPEEFGSLVLRVRYDDGFIAYLNGDRIAEANAPADPEWNSVATTSHSDTQATSLVSFDVRDALSSLRAGRNVLAIQGLNVTESSSDFLLQAQLVGGRPLEGEEGVPLSRTTTLRARTLAGSEWSALVEATFYLAGDLPLRITEIMYHPSEPPEDSTFEDDDFEFIELQNVSTETISLKGVRFTRGIDFDFTGSDVTELGPGEVVLIVENPRAFEERYDSAGLAIAGQYEGNLANGGEWLRLADAFGETIHEFRYEDEWYAVADGVGHSLVVRDARLPPDQWGDPATWTVSPEFGGTPGIHPLDPTGPSGWQISGDANQDGNVDISDPIAVLRYLFLGGGIDLPCDGEADEGGNLTVLDVNGDGGVNISDAVYELLYLFVGGSPPVGGVSCRLVPGCQDACAP